MTQKTYFRDLWFRDEDGITKRKNNCFHLGELEFVCDICRKEFMDFEVYNTYYEKEQENKTSTSYHGCCKKCIPDAVSKLVNETENFEDVDKIIITRI